VNPTSTGDRYLGQHIDRIVQQQQRRRDSPRKVARFAHLRRSLAAALAAHIRPGDVVLDVGCGEADLLQGSAAAHVVGVDLDGRALTKAAAGLTNFTAIEGAIEHVDLGDAGPFDVIVMSGVLELFYDIQAVLQRVRPVTTARSRLVIASYSRVAQPVLRLLELLRLRERPAVYNWVPPGEIRNMLEQSGYEVSTVDHRILVPFHVPCCHTW
jgi:ubiquinone/menaquinone biosynthesis C-methylase UbiE